MTFTVTVEGWDQPVHVEMGETILMAAQRAGLPFPHGCQSGNCGACKSALLSGEVEMAPFSDYALTAEEQASGLVLGCRAVPWSDCRLRLLAEDDIVMHPLRRMTARIVTVEDATHDIKLLKAEILSGGPFIFSAGQYARLTFPGCPPRDFSLASRPGERFLEFHLRRVPGGRTSHYLGEMQPGDTFALEGPFGTSFLRESHRGPILAVAGGTGLAPIKAIVERALEIGLRQEISLYFGAREERDLYLERHFTRLAETHENFRYLPVLSHAEGENGRLAGLVTEVAARDSGVPDGAKLYLAGPPAMVESGVRLFEERGIARSNIHADAFYNEADKPSAKVEP